MRRLLASLAAVVGLTPATPSLAGPVSPQAAPAAWVAYAGQVDQAVAGRLGGTDPAAVRLRDYLSQIPGPTAEQGVQLPIGVWIDGQGVIIKVDFTPFAHPEPDADLRVLLVGYRLSQAPPKGMLLPLRLSIEMEPASRSQGASTGTAANG